MWPKPSTNTPRRARRARDARLSLAAGEYAALATAGACATCLAAVLTETLDGGTVLLACAVCGLTAMRRTAVGALLRAVGRGSLP